MKIEYHEVKSDRAGLKDILCPIERANLFCGDFFPVILGTACEDFKTVDRVH